MSKIKLQDIYEDVTTDLKLVSCMGTRDGGSHHLEFSDGFKCMFDFGINSPTKGKFVKAWKDRTVITPDKKYLDLLRNDERCTFFKRYI